MQDGMKTTSASENEEAEQCSVKTPESNQPKRVPS